MIYAFTYIARANTQAVSFASNSQYNVAMSLSLCHLIYTLACMHTLLPMQMGGSVAGAVSGAAVGAGIGAGVGVFAGPVGLGIGAAVGGITGAVCGAIAGPAPATGMRALHSEDLKTIAKAKYMLWKKQQSERKKHAISHCRQQ